MMWVMGCCFSFWWVQGVLSSNRCKTSPNVKQDHQQQLWHLAEYCVQHLMRILSGPIAFSIFQHSNCEFQLFSCENGKVLMFPKLILFHFWWVGKRAFMILFIVAASIILVVIKALRFCMTILQHSAHGSLTFHTGVSSSMLCFDWWSVWVSSLQLCTQ